MREILFYILDKKENRFIIVLEESEYGYDGHTVDDRGDVTKIYIAKTFITLNIDRFDFSQDEPNLIPAIL